MPKPEANGKQRAKDCGNPEERAPAQPIYEIAQKKIRVNAGQFHPVRQAACGPLSKPGPARLLQNRPLKIMIFFVEFFPVFARDPTI
jgi:hypothetical protein